MTLANSWLEHYFVLLIYVIPHGTWASIQSIGILCSKFSFILGFESSYLKSTFLYNRYPVDHVYSFFIGISRHSNTKKNIKCFINSCYTTDISITVLYLENILFKCEPSFTMLSKYRGDNLTTLLRRTSMSYYIFIEEQCKM